MEIRSLLSTCWDCRFVLSSFCLQCGCAHLYAFRQAVLPAAVSLLEDYELSPLTQGAKTRSTCTGTFTPLQASCQRSMTPVWIYSDFASMHASNNSYATARACRRWA